MIVTLIQVRSSGKCTEQYTIVPGSPGRDSRTGVRGVPGRTGDKGDRGDVGPPGPKGDARNVTISGEYLNRVSDNVTAKINESIITELLDTIQTLNKTFTDHLLYLESRLQQFQHSTNVTLCNITSANWRRIAYFDTMQGDSCPTGLRTVNSTTTNQTACGRTVDYVCTPLTFTTGGTYSNVCGRVRGYQFQHTVDCFLSSKRRSLNETYIDGVSFTQGEPPMLLGKLN